MERKFYTDDFEQLLKEKSDEFRMYPSKRVWHSIYNDLHPARKWPSIAASMLLILALMMVGYWNNNSSKTNIAAHTTNNNAVTHNSNTASGDKLATNNTTLQANTSVANGVNKIVPEKNMRPNPTAVSLRPRNYLASVGGTTLHVTPGTTGHVQHVSKQAGNENNTTLQTAQSNANLNNVQPSANTTTTAENGLNTTPENNGLKNSDFLQQQNSAKASVSASVHSSNNLTATDANPIANNSEEVLTGNDNNIKPQGVNKDQAVIATKETKVLKPAAKRLMTADDDKAWIEDYAFHNKSKRKKWQDRTALELYITPSIGYRTLTNDVKYNTVVPASPYNSTLLTSVDANKSVRQSPGLGLEAGLGITYAVAKNLRFKTGLQVNYTSYGITAEETNHPVLTTLMLVDPNGNSYIKPISSTLANSTGAQAVKVHNKTYQVSLPIGAALKLSGNHKLEWYAGASIQPTLLMGSKALLISADRKNYVEDPSLVRRWNLNAGFETYINYKLDGFTLQAGPQFRYQLLSTFNNTYTVKENLYNIGLKIGIVKNF